MQLINTIAMGIAFIAATASALPRELKFQNKQFSGNPFQVTDLIIDSVEDGDVAIAFTVYDPDLEMFTLGGGGAHCLAQPLRRERVA